MCIRESGCAQCPQCASAQWDWRAVPVPVRLEVHRLPTGTSVCQHGPRTIEASKAPARGPLDYPTHADSMSKILSSRAQCEAISVFLIKHQLALVSVYKKWESAPAPLLSIAHISRALHKDSASVDNRRWAWRVGT